MEIILALSAFVFGVIATVFSDAIASWIVRIISMRFTRWLSAVAANPVLHLRAQRNTPEREIKLIINQLFRAWEEKDLDAYLACWSKDAIRIFGPQGAIEETKEQICEKFIQSCRRYTNIRVESIVLERITLSPKSDSAIVELRYRFSLVRSRDGLPVLEDAKEVYGMRRQDGLWHINSNIDHFYTVGEHVAS